MGRNRKEESHFDMSGIIGGLIVAGIIAIVVMFYRIEVRTAAIEVNTEATAARVDRIAEALPKLGRMFAWEELNKPVDGILLTSKPLQMGDSWFVHSLLMNLADGTRTVFGTEVVGPHDVFVAYRAVGAVERIDMQHQPLSAMIAWSAELERSYELPGMLDDQSSFVFRDAIQPALFDFYGETSGKPLVIDGAPLDNNWEATLEFMNTDFQKAVLEAMAAKYGPK